MTVFNLEPDNKLFLTTAGEALFVQASQSGGALTLTSAKIGFNSAAEGQTYIPAYTGPISLLTQATLGAPLVHAVNDGLLRIRVNIPSGTLLTHAGSVCLFSGVTLVGYFVYATNWTRATTEPASYLEFIIERDYSANLITRTDAPLPSIASLSHLPAASLFAPITMWALYTDAARLQPANGLWPVYYLKNGAWSVVTMPLVNSPVPPSSVSTLSPFYSDDAAPLHDHTSGYMALPRSGYGAQVRATFGLQAPIQQGYMFSDGKQIGVRALPVATETTKGMVQFSTDAEAIAKTANNKALTPKNLAAVLALLIDVKVTSASYNGMTGVLTLGQNDGSTFTMNIQDLEVLFVAPPVTADTLGVTPTIIYGGNTRRLGTPDAWLSVNGYAVPGYLI